MSFSVTILGSSSALPTSKRFTTAHVLNVDERFFLVDCGEGTQIQLRKFKVKFGRINHIFISHLHGDHVLGLPGLLSSYSLLGRSNDLHIYAFKELRQFLKPFSRFIGDKLPFRVIIHELNPDTPEVIYEDRKMFVKSFPLSHGTNVCGFLFQEQPRERNIIKEYVNRFNIAIKDILKIKQGQDYQTETGTIIPNKKLTLPPYKPRSYAFCSDTVYDESIIPYIKNVDILYHEATFGSEYQQDANQTHHSTATEAATIAQKANAERLIIGHYSARYTDCEPLLKEAQTIFSHTYPAEDGRVFNIEQKRVNENHE